ncbi:MAG: hypothetical protein HOI49_03860 [Bacteroidetes bacterium]|jgi:hypothetical protein|nr:hypothetical protein [Bacteroidota bacterium]
MKKTFLVSALLVIPFYFYGQSKKELIKANNDLTYKFNVLLEQNNELNEKYNALKEKHSVSFDTPENYAKSIFKLLKSKNKNEASKLLMSIDDSKFFPDKLSKAFSEAADEDSISVSDFIQNWNDDSKKTFDEAYYGGLNMGINWQSAVFTKAEFIIEYDAKIDTYVIDGYLVFFKSSNKDYSFRIKRAFIINDKPNNWRIRGPYDLQAQKLEKEKREKERLERVKQKEIELKNKPYTPWKLYVGGTNWSYSPDNKETFTEFRCKITNNTEHVVNRVRFRVSIYTGAAYKGGTKVFSKTYDLNRYSPKSSICYSCTQVLSLQPGDMQEIQIPELKDFFLGEDTSDDNKWYAKYEILDVFPKHNK